jgi:four helix bundle protein
MGRYEDLRVWQLAHALSQRIKAVTLTFPGHERYELTSQLRRAVRSVPANLVEGSGLQGPRAFAKHVRIAIGSLREVDYFLLEAREDGYIDQPSYEELVAEVRHVRVLHFRLLKALQRAAR